jgi:asparagine synthase (glutamine-hydrolysing)
MTAIGGCWSFSGSLPPLQACEILLAAQQAYAPDPPVSLSIGSVALGKRLFRILPEDDHDHGPYVSRSGRWSVAADVRLDNRAELCTELGIGLEESAALPDSAILGEALQRWNEDALQKVTGDFAFAAWDRDRERLFLARDVVGRRPLHYHRAGRFFAFSSMPSGLHALPGVPKEPDEAAAATFLAALPEEGSRTFFKGIERVLPGHYCVVTASGFSTTAYWNPPLAQLRLRTPEDYVEAVREQFDRAVADRLRGGGGRIASQLSGGLDSGAVTATAARLLGPGGKVVALTTVPRKDHEWEVRKGHVADEGPMAAETAALYPNIEHVLVRSAGRSPLSLLEWNFEFYQRPVLNVCNAVGGAGMMAAARQRNLSIMLVGALGNMTTSYSGLERLPDMLAQGKLLRLARATLQISRHELPLASLLSQIFGPFLHPRLWLGLKRWQGRYVQLNEFTALNPDRADEIRQASSVNGLDYTYRPRRDSVGARLWAIRRVDPGNYVKGSLGGWGIDMRDPTSDRRLIELCLSIPPDEYLRGGQSRSIARRAFADRLPPSIAGETRRGLQATDWHQGVAPIQAEVASEVERIAEVPAARFVLDIPRLRELVRNWPTGDWNSAGTQASYRFALLRALSVGHFLRRAAGSSP